MRSVYWVTSNSNHNRFNIVNIEFIVMFVVSWYDNNYNYDYYYLYYYDYNYYYTTMTYNDNNHNNSYIVGIIM